MTCMHERTSTLMLDIRRNTVKHILMLPIILIVHNVRSCFNVGSILRTSVGMGIQCVYLTGYTPYPASSHDTRLPHESRKLDAQIHKTALGAERLIEWTAAPNVFAVIRELKADGFTVAALEQASH